MATETQPANQPAKQSRLGKRPVPVPKGVTINISGSAISGCAVEVQGPKGKLKRVLPERIVLEKEGDALVCSSDAPGQDALRLQGLGRALVASMVKGAAEGYERILELVGTGYRCEVKGKTITFSLGKSHQNKIDLPDGLTATVPGDSKGTILILNAADKEMLGQIAAKIRSFRPPEPYGGKGIRYRGEQIRRKAGKAGKGRK